MDMGMPVNDTAVSQLPSLRNNYAALVISTTTCGIYIPIVAITLYHYFKNRKQQAAQRLILGYSLAMGLLTIGSYITTTISMEALLVEAPAGTPAAASAANLMAAPGSSMTSMCTPINTVANIILTLQYLLGDALMLYRVYVLYGKQWAIIAAPLVLWTGFLALGIVIPVSCVVRDGMELVPAKAFIPILSTWYLITATFQISTSGMIVYKLMQHERNMHQNVPQMSGGASAYASLATMMVESAVLYAAVTLLYIIVWLADPAAQWQTELCYLSASLAVLNPAFIILRISMGKSSTSGHTLSTTAAQSSVSRSKSEARIDAWPSAKGAAMRSIGSSRNGIELSGVRVDYEVDRWVDR